VVYRWVFDGYRWVWSDGRLESQQVRFRGTGELARSRLSTQLLDQLRRSLK
jgi:hypothetical protein